MRSFSNPNFHKPVGREICYKTTKCKLISEKTYDHLQGIKLTGQTTKKFSFLWRIIIHGYFSHKLFSLFWFISPKYASYKTRHIWKKNCSNHAFLEFDKYKEVRNKFFRYANHDKTRRNGKGSKKAILVIYFRFFTFFPCPDKRQLLFFFQICKSNICRHKIKTWLFTQRAFGNTMQSDQFIILYMGNEKG